jgi:solute carrier family 25 S-adenosylmethionine transporter 26
LIGSAPSAALFFISYESLKAAQKQAREGDNPLRPFGAWSEPVEQMIAASVGEIAACAVRVPTEVVKQRAQAMQAESSLAALRSVLGKRRKVGWNGVCRELYRGLGITVMREVPFTVIQFPLWESMKAWRRRQKGGEENTTAESAAFGSVAGAMAAALTTPLDVLKTRMMLAGKRLAVVPLARHILREEGPKAFVAGLGPRIIWISAGGAIFLGSYQFAYNALTSV